MAFLIKQSQSQRSSAHVGTGLALVNQWIHVSTPTRTQPASTTDVIFKVRGGRGRVHLLLGEVTTVLEGTDSVTKYSSQKLDAAMTATVGTAVDIASTLDTSSFEVGSLLVIEGDGTAFVKSNAGAAFLGASGEVGPWIAPR